MTHAPDTPAWSLLGDEAGVDPIEDRLRANVRVTIEAVLEEEIAIVLDRLRYGRGCPPAKVHRPGHRERQHNGTFDSETALPSRLHQGRGRQGDGIMVQGRCRVTNG